MNELISVIIPTYNRGKLITKSINSVLNQTYPNVEVIVVDDGSSDNTEKVVRKIKDNRVKFYKYKKNKGACYARNYGIKKAKGKYIAFQDSDDIYRVDKLEKQLNNIISEKSDMSFCKFMYHVNDETCYITPNDEKINDFNKNGYINSLCQSNFVSTQTILIKANIIKEYLFDESLPRFQDFDLALRMLPNIKISFCNEVLSDVYVQSDSISSNTAKLKAAIDIIMFKDYNINIEQKSKLDYWLTDLLYINLNKDNELKIDKINERINEMKLLADKKEMEYKELEEKYNGIINSKRWKYINNIVNKITNHK